VPLSAITDITDLSTAIDKGGVVVVLVGVVFGLAWVGWRLLQRLLEAKDAQIASEREEKAAWRAIALGNQRTAEGTVAMAEHTVGLR